MDIVSETLDKNGTVVIPSFAVGRTQEIVYEINKLKEQKDDEEFRKRQKEYMARYYREIRCGGLPPKEKKTSPELRARVSKFNSKPCIYEGREYNSRQECMYKERITQNQLYRYHYMLLYPLQHQRMCPSIHHLNYAYHLQ